MSDDELGARLIGRDKKGIALHHQGTSSDPLTEPKINFEEEDKRGERTPLFAHIRSMYSGSPPLDIIKRRILRRGITYGKPYADDPEVAKLERGIYFIAYMANIREQFEVLQGRFANTRDSRRGGVDPLVGEGRGRHFLPVKDETAKPFDFARCVRTTGAIYTFVPSKATLEGVAAGKDFSSVSIVPSASEISIRPAPIGT
jgi:deferrochelatase/peroxidase EfeB